MDGGEYSSSSSSLGLLVVAACSHKFTCLEAQNLFTMSSWLCKLFRCKTRPFPSHIDSESLKPNVTSVDDFIPLTKSRVDFESFKSHATTVA